MSNENISNKIARIENKFIFHAQYKLTSREQKVILYLIANINPKVQERFIEQIIPVRELEQVLKSDGKKWGGLYEEMRTFAKRIRAKGIEFDTNILIDGKRFPAYVNWFQSVVPVEREDGEVCIRFLFSQDLEPFLLSLNQYAKINRLEVAPMRSGFSIRMFQIFRAHRDKMQKHEKISELTYDVEALKALLGISGSYSEFRDFNKRVLLVVQKEINENTSILIKEIKKDRNSKRRITHITFVFLDQETEDVVVAPIKNLTTKQYKKSYGDQLPSVDEVATLTQAQLNAYNVMVDFGIKEGIAFKQILAKITGSEVEGFEDWYIKEAIQIFKLKTNLKTKNARAGAFVKWFLKEKVFDQGDHFATIMERLSKRKKRLSQKQWDERKLAATMSAEAFHAALVQQEDQRPSPIASKTRSKQLIDIIEVDPPKRRVKKTEPFDFERFKKNFTTDYEQIKLVVEQEMEDFLTGMERPSNYKELINNAIKTRCEHWYREQQA